MRAFADISRKMPVIFPMHPRTRARLTEFGIDISDSHITILDPVGYHDSLALTQSARCVVTDSGGLQEESTFFKTPCLTLRPNTERPVTITVGSNRLIKTHEVFERLDEVLRGGETLGQIPEFWDGSTSERVVQALLEYQDVTAAPAAHGVAAADRAAAVSHT
jgi:UDP-N-acetylglucosamine 2-epimerase (non-hydrolysing)